MDARNLRPARDFAIQYGFKGLVYGPPGSAKTPLINTAPRPLMLACEPGLLSMRNSTVPTYPAFSADAIDEFFKWFFNSSETRNFDTIAVDSATEMAEIYLRDIMAGRSSSGKKVHGLAAYGDMAKKVLEHLGGLYFTQNKHTYVICKQEVYNDNGFMIKRPYFPGNLLNTEIPYKYDAILQLDIQSVPGLGQTRAFRCIGNIDTMARNRTGMLGEFEPPHYGQLIQKALA